MEEKFEGYSEGEFHGVSLPPTFFRELLPDIDHLGELKVTLFAFWGLEKKEGAFRYLRREDFSQVEHFMEGLGKTDDIAQKVLDESLARAVHRGSLLVAAVTLDQGDEGLYFLNTPKGQAAVRAINEGEWLPTGDPHLPLELVLEKPNIYRIYEQNIGPITPMIAEELRAAEKTYSPQWIEDAVRIAVENNARNWRYVEAILERWQLKGRDERKDRRDTEKARLRYKEWENPD
jgi:DnaD/phage-associated family protein